MTTENQSPEQIKSSYLAELSEIVRTLDTYRAGTQTTKPVNISLQEFIKEKYGLGLDAYYDVLDVNPKIDTMQNIFNFPDPSYRWLVPEIMREAIMTGMTDAPIFPSIIAGDTPVNGLNIIMPYINQVEAAPARLNEAETIPLGTLTFGQKSVNIFKIGKGIKITDEVKNYVSLDVMALFVRDFGIKLGYALDALAIDVLLNGNLPSGAESAPNIGVTNVGSTVYRDLLRIWVRGSRIGRKYTTLIGDEEAGIDLLDLPEFKVKSTGTTEATLNLKTPVPSSADFFIHPGIPDNHIAMIDRTASLLKLTARQLMLEAERIVSNQTEATYATLTTGFSKMYQDGTLLLDSTTAFSGFPSYMNPDPFLLVNLQ
jgi:hypothetical protein